MLTAALALLLASAPADAPLPAEGAPRAVEVLPDPPVPPRPNRGGLRVAVGAGVLQDTSGVVPLLDAGYAYDFWPRMGFRLDTGLAIGVGWTALQAGPSLVVRGAGPGAFLTPYATAGANVAALSVNDALAPSSARTRQPALGGAARYTPAASPVGDGGDVGAGASQGGSVGATFRLSFGPSAGGGLQVRVVPDLVFDLAVRYELRVHGGSAHSGGAATAGVVSAF